MHLFRLLHQFSSRRSRDENYTESGFAYLFHEPRFIPTGRGKGIGLNFQEEFHEVYQRLRGTCKVHRHYHMNSQSQKLARRASCNQLVISWKSRRPKCNQPVIFVKISTGYVIRSFLPRAWDDNNRWGWKKNISHFQEENFHFQEVEFLLIITVYLPELRSNMLIVSNLYLIFENDRSRRKIINLKFRKMFHCIDFISLLPAY